MLPLLNTVHSGFYSLLRKSSAIFDATCSMLEMVFRATGLMGESDAHILLPEWTQLPPTSVIVAHSVNPDDEHVEIIPTHAVVFHAYGVQRVLETVHALHALPDLHGIASINVPVAHITVLYPQRLFSLMTFLYTRDAQYFAHHLAYRCLLLRMPSVAHT